MATQLLFRPEGITLRDLRTFLDNTRNLDEDLTIIVGRSSSPITTIFDDRTVGLRRALYLHDGHKCDAPTTD